MSQNILYLQRILISFHNSARVGPGIPIAGSGGDLSSAYRVNG